VTALRAFLRFCFLEGLVEAGPRRTARAAAGGRRSPLPNGISQVSGRALAVRPTAGAATPPVFAGTQRLLATHDGGRSWPSTLVPTHRGTAWPAGMFSSATGKLLRQLTAPSAGESDLVLAVRGGRVYFAAGLRVGLLSGVRRVPLAGGPARLVRAGAITYVLSPDGQMAASLVTADHGRTIEIVVSNLFTAYRSTIVMATSPPGYGTVGVTNLA